MMLCVKICGLTRREDVASAVAAGADCVGFVLYERSPRFVTLAQLRHLTAEVPSGVRRVGVVVNAPAEVVAAAIDAGGLDVVQFHGDESVDRLRAFHLASAWKAVGLRVEADVEAAAAWPAEALVVDAVGTAARGGTGSLCDWDLAGRLSGRRRIVLAGGLHPDNVAQAVARVRPFGVDVSSGVESSPGIKDHDRIRRFVATARDAAAAVPDGAAVG